MLLVLVAARAQADGPDGVDIDVDIDVRDISSRGEDISLEHDSRLSQTSGPHVRVACDDRDPDCPARLAAAPALSAVVTAALHAAGVANNPVPSWRRRSRWSALVPAISARVGNSQSWREITDPTVSRAASYDVRASWRLDRLIYDPNEPRFAAFDISRRRERRHITALTSRAYVTWVQAWAANALIEAEVAHVELDVLTDGWFSETLARRERDRHLADRPTFGRVPQ